MLDNDILFHTAVVPIIFSLPLSGKRIPVVLYGQQNLLPNFKILPILTSMKYFTVVELKHILL